MIEMSLDDVLVLNIITWIRSVWVLTKPKGPRTIDLFIFAEG